MKKTKQKKLKIIKIVATSLRESLCLTEFRSIFEHARNFYAQKKKDRKESLSIMQKKKRKRKSEYC